MKKVSLMKHNVGTADGENAFAPANEINGQCLMHIVDCRVMDLLFIT